MECSHCHQNNIEGAVFCTACGKPLMASYNVTTGNAHYPRATPIWVWLILGLVILGLTVAVIILATRISAVENFKPEENIPYLDPLSPTPTPYVTVEILGTWQSDDVSEGMTITFNLDGTLIVSEYGGEIMIAHYEIIPPNTLHLIPPIGMGESDQYATYIIEGDQMYWTLDDQTLHFYRSFIME